MTGIAIAVLVLAGLLVWGGLVASIVYLARHGRSPLEDDDGGSGSPSPGTPGSGRPR